MIIMLLATGVIIFLLGMRLLFGQSRQIAHKVLKENAALTRKEIVMVAGTFLFVGALLIISAGMAIFTRNPYWLLDTVFGIFM